jgi:SagB-type dehydrogenase family enzyme
MSNGVAISAKTGAVAERVLVPRLIGDATCIRLSDGRLRFEGPGASATLPPLPAALSEVLSGLEGNSRAIQELCDSVESTNGAGLTALLFAHLARLSAQGSLTYHLVVDGEEYASIEPTGMQYRFLIQPIPDETAVRLSRFSVIRREDDHMVLESGLGHALVRIRNASLMALTGMMSSSQTPAALSAHAGLLGLPADAVAGLLVLFMNGNHVERADATDGDDLRLWNPHDLLFHMSSRYGRLGGYFGGNFRHIGEIDPAPALRPLPDGARVALPVPVLEDVLRDDPPFQEVVETRRSIYTYSPTPITVDELGEFLYRVARVRWIGSQPVSSNVTGRSSAMDVTSRPIPAGGRGYELELYLTISECVGLDPGMYHYDPAGHQLTRLRSADGLTEQMLTFAAIASTGVRPKVLITIAARFRRMMWKYDRLAYAATLKHVGVMMHQMYLAATAMQLAPSALGSGNIETFAAATGNDPIVEGSVGEFMLGSSPLGQRRHRPTMLRQEPSP